MTIKGSHLAPHIEAGCNHAVRRFGIPLVPTLLGALAVLNVASVVMVLME